MRGIDEDIKKKSFKPVYLLYGPENYLKNYYRDRIKSALLGEDDMNYTLMSGENADIGEMKALAETMPFFADKRLLVVIKSGMFAKGNDELADFIPRIPETVCVVFIEDEVKKNTRPYKAAAKYGEVTELVTPTDSRWLYKWLMGRMKVGDKTLQIKKAAWETFLRRTNDDMYHMQNEMDKLVAYCAEREYIDVCDVEAICAGVLEDRIFDMIRAIAGRNRSEAMRLYRDLLLLKEAPMKILVLLTNQLRNIYRIKEMSRERIGDDEIARRMHIPGFAVGRNRQLGANFTEEQLRGMLSLAARTEEDIKMGNLTDRIAVEMLMTRFVK